MNQATKARENHVAPGELEDVRTLLNTWRLPNSTRTPEDNFDDFATRQGITNAAEVAQLRRLRDDLRKMVEGEEKEIIFLNSWLREIPLRVTVEESEAGLAIRYKHDSGRVGEILTVVLKAVEAEQWSRLKACPDCRWVFFDHSRNASKKWCGMYAKGPEGRACGTIAKVRRHRARQKRKG